LCRFREVIAIPRRRKKCWVEFLPPVTYYKPAGVPLRELDEVVLTVEEFEALRLKDMDGLEQVQCAERMGIARTTFQRILYAARYKVTEALVKGKAIRIEGGEYVLPTERLFWCAACGSEFEVPSSTNGEIEVCCPSCGQGSVHRFHNCRGQGRGRMNGLGRKGLCQKIGDEGSKRNAPEDDD
jgi:predicted DNA-binding protein (UPF0251 family)